MGLPIVRRASSVRVKGPWRVDHRGRVLQEEILLRQGCAQRLSADPVRLPGRRISRVSAWTLLPSL